MEEIELNKALMSIGDFLKALDNEPLSKKSKQKLEIAIIDFVTVNVYIANVQMANLRLITELKSDKSKTYNEIKNLLDKCLKS